jgi:hypothetical protein
MITKNFKFLMFPLIILLLCMCYACEQKAPENPKDDTKPADQTANVEQKIPDPAVLPDELIAQQIYTFNQMALIETSFVHFHTATLSMPANPQEMIDSNFPVFWPKNTFTGAPVRWLATPPDPNNPAHRGEFYYNRVDNNQASIQFLAIDTKNSTPDNIVYRVETFDIEAPMANRARDISSDKDPYFSLGMELAGFTQEQRYNYAYKQVIAQPLHYLISFYMKTHETPFTSMLDLLADGRYFILSNGYEHMKSMINGNNLVFQIGYIDKDHALYNVNFAGEEKDVMYLNTVMNADGKTVGSTWDATEGEPVNVFDQSMIDDLVIPESLFINPEFFKK